MKENKFVKVVPNLITSTRILAAIALIFLEPFSVEFFVIYGLAGLSDALDGFFARLLKASSKLGSVLDSISDLLFYTILAVKIVPTLINIFEWYHWAIIAVPFVFHMLGYLLCALKFKKFSSIHTYANKIMSFFIFFFPFFLINQIYWLYTIYMIVGGVFALYSSIEINLIHIFTKEYSEKNKSIFLIKKNSNNKAIEQ